MIKASTVPSTVESSHPIPVALAIAAASQRPAAVIRSPNVLRPVPLEASAGTAQALKQF